MYCIWEGKYVTDWQTEWGIPLLEVHESLSSTNSRARELLQGGAPSFSAIVCIASPISPKWIPLLIIEIAFIIDS